MTHTLKPQFAGERAKYHAILQLSRQQISALENDDFPTFQTILAAKGKLIDALEYAGTLAACDASFAELVEQIRSSERRAEVLLRSRLHQTGGQLSELRERKTARRAYQMADRSRSLTPALAVADTPRLFDLHS